MSSCSYSSPKKSDLLDRRRAPRSKVYALFYVESGNDAWTLMVKPPYADDVGLPGGTVDTLAFKLDRLDAWDRAKLLGCELIRECNEELGAALMGYLIEGQIPLVTVQELLDRSVCYQHTVVSTYVDNYNIPVYTKSIFYCVNITTRLMQITGTMCPTNAITKAEHVSNNPLLSRTSEQSKEVLRVEFVPVAELSNGAKRVWEPHAPVVSSVVKMLINGMVVLRPLENFERGVANIPVWIMKELQLGRVINEQNLGLQYKDHVGGSPFTRLLKAVVEPLVYTTMRVLSVANTLLMSDVCVEETPETLHEVWLCTIALMRWNCNVRHHMLHVAQQQLLPPFYQPTFWIARFALKTTAMMIINAHPEKKNQFIASIC
jgi:hypothetical protein